MNLNKYLNTIIISVTILISIVLLSQTYKNRHHGNDTIDVTGLGKKDFNADLIVWTGSFTQIDINLETAYEALNSDQEIIKEYLNSKEVNADETVFSSVDINKDFKHTYDDNGNSHSKFVGYRLVQNIEIKSYEVDKIEILSREITELIHKGVEINSYNPQYYYTKLPELKIEMIATATEDARIRAENIAKNSGASIGSLKSARMGVFQITAQNSNEDYSWGGVYNTSSRYKTASITMKLVFGIR
jgi:uncharacterized protein